MSVVGRHSGRAEAGPRGYVDRLEKRILAVVGAEKCKSHFRRKGKGSLAMQISQGLIDPNHTPNRRKGKGKQVNIPVLSKYAWQHKLCFRLFWLG